MKSILFALAIVMAILTGPAHTRAQDADTPVSSDNPLAGTTWQLVSLGVAPVVEGSIITLGFNPDGSSGGNAGCNGYGAGYTLDGDALTFESPMSTMMYCEPEALMTQEIAYLAALASVTRYTLDGGALLLEGDQTLLSFERVGLPEVQWRLVSIDGAPVIEGSEADLTLHEADGLASGFSGCNRFSGGYQLTDDGRIVFDALASTEMACADTDKMAQEAAYIAALSAGGAAGLRYTVTLDTLTLLTDEDGGALVFERVQPLDGTTWVITHIMDEPVIATDSPLTLRFEDGGISGYGGCNTFGGRVRLNLNGTISLGDLVSTRRACVDEALGQQEAALFNALSLVMSYGIEGDSLAFFTHDGEGAVRATRQP